MRHVKLIFFSFEATRILDLFCRVTYSVLPGFIYLFGDRRIKCNAAIFRRRVRFFENACGFSPGFRPGRVKSHVQPDRAQFDSSMGTAKKSHLAANITAKGRAEQLSAIATSPVQVVFREEEEEKKKDEKTRQVGLQILEKKKKKKPFWP